MENFLAPGYGLLVINDVIMTSLLWLKVINVLANSLILSAALLFEVFLVLRGKIDGIWILQ